MKDHYAILYLLAFLFIFAAMWVVFIKLGRQADKYDERQEINRGKAFKAGFAAVCIWELLYFMAEISGISVPAEGGLIAICGVMAGICVFAVRSILTDAYFPINRSSNAVIAFWLAISLMDITVGIWNIIDGKLITDGRLNCHAASLAAGILLLILSLTCVIRKLTLRHAEAED